MKPAKPRILTINGGSSSIKFALFEVDDSLQRILEGGIERIGLPNAALRVKGINPADNFSKTDSGDRSYSSSGLPNGLDRAAQSARCIGCGRASHGAWRSEILETGANHCKND